MEIAENGNITVKVLVKSSYVFDVPNYTAIRDGSVMGQAIKSPSFVVGGCPFRILFYPHGRNEAAHSRGEVSLFIRNESSKAVESTYSLHILEQIQPYSRPPIHVGFSFENRSGFREVTTLRPIDQDGNFYFEKRDCVEDPNNGFLVGDCLKIRAIVGVFIDHTFSLLRLHQPIDRYIFFQLERLEFEQYPRRYFADEFIVVSQCPRLLPYNYRCYRDVLVSDIKPDVFEVVLWFSYNHNLDIYDSEAIRKSNPSEPDSYASRMLAAADRFDMKHFRRQCESIISRNTEEHGLFYKIKSNLEKLLGGPCRRLLDLSKDIKNE